MNFPDSEVIAAAEPVLLDPVESDHHEDCPQHPWNDVLDVQEPCECPELRAADAAERGDAVNGERKGA